MYDNVVKDLREISGNRAIPVHMAKTAKEAADAIEELMRRCEQFQYMPPPAWIPVSERLPEETGTYLVWMKWDLTEADEEPSAYPVLYDADAEGFGWWKSYYSGETLGWAGEDFVRYEGITHWMPLPEPPKEG